METLGDNNMLKICYKYYCEICDYGTCKKSSYNNHIMSAKHSKRVKGDKNGDESDTNNSFMLPSQLPCEKKIMCEICAKQYTSRNGLWKHKKKCFNKLTDENELVIDKELVMLILKQNQEIMKQNAELQNQMFEVIKNGTTINTNSHNKTFNLQFFLNETCKDAMNIMDFVDSIKLTLSDLEKVGQIGYVEGISNIITTNLKALDVTQRPIHCTDTKREILYVKDENKWEKEAEKKDKIRKAIKCVANKNIRMLPKFKEIHPDCVKSESNYSDQYNTLMVESFGGSGNNDLEKENKIIKKISKEIIVDK